MSLSETSQWNEIEQLEVSIHQLTNCANLVSFHGINPSALGILKAHNLLTGCSLEPLSLESVRREDTIVAVEALSDSAKTKAAEWSARILAFVKTTVNKTMDFVATLRAKINATSKAIGDKSVEVFDKGVAYAKAHPYKTILGVLAAAALTVAVIRYASMSAPGVDCKGSQLKSYFDKIKSMTQSIQSPFTKVSKVQGGEDAVTSNIINFTNNALATTPGSVEKLSVLGWTKTNFMNVVKQIEGVFDSFTAVMKPFWDNVIKPIDKVVSTVGFFPKVVGEKIKEKTSTRAELEKAGIFMQTSPEANTFQIRKEKTKVFLQKGIEVNDTPGTKIYIASMKFARYPQRSENSQATSPVSLPIHDWTSHHRTANEYLAVNLDKANIMVDDKERYKKYENYAQPNSYDSRGYLI